MRSNIRKISYLTLYNNSLFLRLSNNYGWFCIWYMCICINIHIQRTYSVFHLNQFQWFKKYIILSNLISSLFLIFNKIQTENVLIIAYNVLMLDICSQKVSGNKRLIYSENILRRYTMYISKFYVIFYRYATVRQRCCLASNKHKVLSDVSHERPSVVPIVTKFEPTRFASR